MPIDDQKDLQNGFYAQSSENNNRAAYLSTRATYDAQRTPEASGNRAIGERHRPTTTRDIDKRLLFQQRRKRVNRVLMRKRYNNRNQNHTLSRVATTLVILLAVLVVILSGSGGGAFAYYQSQLPILNKIASHSLFQTTRIYDRNGKLLYQLYDHSDGHGRRTYVDFANIPNNLINATIAIEDHSFWQNSGIDYTGIARAVIANANGVREGGSTITQELIKIQFFSNTLNDRTPQLKAQEAVLAIGLTRQYSKAKIMEMYLNTVFYGDNNYGVEAAAQDYFNLKPKCNSKGQCIPAIAQLDLAQASLIAGLPQSPSLYMPFANKEEALKRQTEVLDNMVSQHMITSVQENQAEKEMQNYKFKPSPVVLNAPHFVNYLIDTILIPLFGAANLENGGYSIYTTLDLDLEREVEAISKKWIETNAMDSYGESNLRVNYNLNNAAVVVQDPKTGEILAMDGSVDYNSIDLKVNGQFNSAVDAIRQPGSSFKPFVYATAFEKGWYPGMVIPDVQTTFPNGQTPYAPPNYDGRFHGATLTARYAIANSYNIPAIDALEFAGIPDVLTTAGRMGLPNVAATPKSKQGPAMALGTSGESLLNMTGAYSVFADGGVRMPQTSVLRIDDNQGNTIYQLPPPGKRGERVLRADVAYLVTSMISDVNARHQEFAPGNPLELDRPVAAKTGTTDNFVDNWTMGYTPNITVGVWAGNSDNSPMANNSIGITGAGPIWHDVMTWADQHYHFPIEDFAKPADVVQAALSKTTGLAPAAGDGINYDWVINGQQPTIVGSNSYTTPTQPKRLGLPVTPPGQNGGPPLTPTQ
ncbi:penicillin-binding protein [Ktedonobacteria bacterium brp13]|nr:penicillin-binding protein [Ktedonobacteria bacterium brp13]